MVDKIKDYVVNESVELHLHKASLCEAQALCGTMVGAAVAEAAGSQHPV